MGIRFVTAVSSRRIAAAGFVAAISALSGCYVVPIDVRTGQPVPAHGQPFVAPAPGPVSFPVRLYPVNDAATRYGVVSASVTNDLQGKGTFSASINGESFVGEATRRADSGRNGIANGAGNRGSYLSCSYTMNGPTQGTGQCRLSDGAVFTMHMGH